MMQSWATFNIRFPKSDQAKWAALVKGLARNEHGAYLEEYAEAFGPKAGALIGFVLDEWEKESERDVIQTRSSKVFPGKATIDVGGFRSIEPSVQPMVKFLKACGATDVQVEKQYESDNF